MFCYVFVLFFFFFKQKTAYEMRISDWSSDVCSSDLLDGRRSVPCDSLVEWSMWMAEGDRRVAETWIDDVRISTVFLGLDHNHALGGDPLLFETIDRKSVV